MIKKLLSYLGQYKKATLWTPVFVTLEVVMEVVIPLLMANLIDYGIDGGSMPHIVKIGLALLIAAAISLLFGMLAGRSAAAASAGFAKNLRQAMYYKVQTYSFANIDKFSTGQHRDPADHGCEQRADGLPNDHPHGYACAGDAGVFAGGVLQHRR